ncbi:hypothetical protein Fmac_002985 [Flemingia macrophylla]|uniref:Legume lectin domain-containing protein n=1 Tax=Flemingia macrophylla TaxID=520843 RepID=A0ABD1NLI2_9FABA
MIGTPVHQARFLTLELTLGLLNQWQLCHGHLKWNRIPVVALAHASLNYNSESKRLSAFVRYSDNRNATVSAVVDLRNVLPEWIMVGFSASTAPTKEPSSSNLHIFGSSTPTLSRTSPFHQRRHLHRLLKQDPQDMAARRFSMRGTNEGAQER